MAEKKAKGSKGRAKTKPDMDNPEENPLLHIENKHDFKIETDNLLENPDRMIYAQFENFDLRAEKDHFDIDKINNESLIIIILRYYEYLCVAEFKFCYILPLLHSGLAAKDIFEMVKHSLKSKLLINVPSFETVYEPEIQYVGKIKYDGYDNMR